MLEEHYISISDLLSEIPSFDNPDISARDDIFNFMQEASWRSMARLVDHAGKPMNVSSMGFDNRDRLALLRLILRSEIRLACVGSTMFSTAFLHDKFLVDVV